MKRQNLEEWIKEGKELFGEDFSQWKFICPACGHISTVKDFEAFGGDVNDAYQNCIGRFNGKGAKGIAGKDEGNGCDWAAYGLFGNLGKGRIVIQSNGKETQVFDFATHSERK